MGFYALEIIASEPSIERKEQSAIVRLALRTFMAYSSNLISATDTVTDYRKLFIVGCPRSGTTWLWKLIDSHPDVISAPRESHLYRLIYQPFTYVTKLGTAERWKQGASFLKNYGVWPMIFGASSDTVWRGILRNYRRYDGAAGNVGLHTIVSYPELTALIREVRQAPGEDLEHAKHLIKVIIDRYFYQAGGEAHNLFVEKTPMHISCSDVILKQFPEAKVIIINRDGRDVCASWQARAKTQKWARRSTEKLIKQWKRCVELSRQFQADPQIKDRIRMVRYEDLRKQPEEESAKLLDFLELSYTPEQVKGFVNKLDIKKVTLKGENEHVRKGHVGDWKQSLSEQDIHLWQTKARETLLQLGYTF